ncbi:hypothetical protein J7E62_08210 [Variovorax paradoxus]|nr:hypothetical protein [Variovorax paradoxus]
MMTLLTQLADPAFDHSSPAPAQRYFQVVTWHGRVMVRVTTEALLALGSDPETESLDSTLALQMPRLRSLALQLAGRSQCREVTIRSSDIWWSGADR